MDPDQNLAGLRHGLGDVAEFECVGAAECCQYHCFHDDPRF